MMLLKRAKCVKYGRHVFRFFAFKKNLLMSYSYPQVGAFRADGQCRFCVWAPTRKKVDTVVNGNSFPMQRDERGYWSVTLPDISHGSLYKFKLDDQYLLPDPASRSQPEGVHGNSAVIDRAFDWTDQLWQGIALKDMIIYELHVGTFTSEGTFEGIISKLEYLISLGINTIEVMPIGQFPGNRNWGYDGVFPFAAQHSYGGVAGFKKLVDACHASNIAVILDVVYNHQGPEGNYLGMFGPYFTDKYKTGWGQAINFDDAYSDAVRSFYWQNALMWLDEFHLDGLRLDAVHAIWDNGANHFILELSRKVRALEEVTDKKKVLIAEFDLNNPRYINAVEKGGYGLDGQWIDEYHHALHALVTKQVDGYYEDFGSIEDFAKSIRDSYVYTGQYSRHRKKHFGGSASENHYGQFVVFLQNHDQVGNRMLGDRISHQLSFEQLKLAAAAYLLSPHVPMLFMGEEYGEKNPFQYFISHTDKDLIEAVRKGRREEFSYFNWTADLPDPQHESTFNACKLSWSYQHNRHDKALLDFYKHLIAFRKNQPAMKEVDRTTVKLWPEGQQEIVAFERRGAEQSLLIVLNFENTNVSYRLDESRKFRILLDSSAKMWLGDRENVTDKTFLDNTLFLNPHSVMVLKLL
jgi:maltooligosyltrehalose trehalohydrolase